jgi:hypothetical protein
MRGAALLAVLVLTMAACGRDDGGTGADLTIERRVGYVVALESGGNSLLIGFDENRDARGGEQFEVASALWRVDDGLWNEPPVTCIGLGKRIELGIAEVQNVDRPGLLLERVVWLSCLEAEE